MNKDVFTKILEDHKELSSLPQAIAEIIKTSRDANASTNDLSRSIMKDPSLTARVLRVVNSPYYSPAQPVTTISQAVKMLGSRAIIAMALAASIYKLVTDVNSTISRKKFWRHSLETALAAQAIARAVKYESPEEAFICGLLHDIGILVLEASYPEIYTRLWKMTETGERLIDIEEEQWGTNHARVGQFLMRQWGLPELICDAVGGHHTMFGPEDSHNHQKIILITNLANRISKFRIGNVPPPESKVIEMKRVMIKNLNLNEESLAEIERGLISEVVRESGYLEIEIGNADEILGEANLLLYEQYMTVENMLLENMKSADRAMNADERIEVFGKFLNRLAGGMKRRSIILKQALEKEPEKDPINHLNETVKDVAKWAELLTKIIEEQQKSVKVDNYWESHSYKDFENICNNVLKGRAQKENLEQPAKI